MKHRIPLLMVLGCIALGACERVDPVDATIDPVFARRATNLPFKTYFSGTTSMVGVCAEGAGVLLLSAGTGTGTHVGAATVSIEMCIDMAAMLPLEPVTGSMVAANGDTLLMVLTAEGVPDPVTGELWSEWAITGGTGRFVGAAGEFTNRGRQYPDWSWYTRSEGWISLRQ
jgi:hypothetical protein